MTSHKDYVGGLPCDKTYWTTSNMKIKPWNCKKDGHRTILYSIAENRDDVFPLIKVCVHCLNVYVPNGEIWSEIKGLISFNEKTKEWFRI